MRAFVVTLRWIVRLSGLTLLGLGLLFWSGHALDLVDLHMAIGVLLVLTLWTAAALAARSTRPDLRVGVALVWGIVVPVFGVLQVRLLPGSAHWIIQLLHLVVGASAIGQTEALLDRVTPR